LHFLIFYKIFIYLPCSILTWVKLTKKNLLELEPRRKIYQFILSHPGLHLRELSKKLWIPKTSLTHHLDYLEKRDLITVRYMNRYKRYYISQKYGAKEKDYLALIRQPVTRNIILILCLKDVFSQKQIVDFLKGGSNVYKHPTTVAFHLDKLEKIGLIESFSLGNEKKYILNDRGIFIDLFIIHEKSFLDYKLIKKYFYWMNNIPIDYVDKLIDEVYRIFPHPYYA